MAGGDRGSLFTGELVPAADRRDSFDGLERLAADASAWSPMGDSLATALGQWAAGDGSLADGWSLARQIAAAAPTDEVWFRDVGTGETRRVRAEDQYWDYPWERCMVREDSSAFDTRAFITFYGKTEEEVPTSHRIYSEVLLGHATPIDAATYAAGKPGGR